LASSSPAYGGAVGLKCWLVNVQSAPRRGSSTRSRSSRTPSMRAWRRYGKKILPLEALPPTSAGCLPGSGGQVNSPSARGTCCLSEFLRAEVAADDSRRRRPGTAAIIINLLNYMKRGDDGDE